MVFVSEKKQISLDAKPNVLDKIIKKKSHFEIASRTFILFIFSFIYLVIFLLFMSEIPYYKIIGIIFSIAFSIAFIVSVITEVIAIDFQQDHFSVKHQFFTKQYKYTELSDIEIHYLSGYRQAIVSLTIGKYSDTIAMMSKEPLELFFYAQYALKRFLENQEYPYSEIYQALNDKQKSEVKTIAILKKGINLDDERSKETKRYA